MINIPEAINDLPLVVSVSGGKDSTALVLALREAGADVARYVFADTGWEAPETYAYLDLLREKLGIVIDVVRAEPKTAEFKGGMVDRIIARAGFPARMQRWCTRELKLEPLRAYHDRLEDQLGVETVCVVGVRGAESVSRSKMPELEDEPVGARSWGGWVWRPLLAWTVEDVLAAHHRASIPVNPLYLRGHDRVGCYPCIFARKDEVRLVAEHAPERIDQIRALEAKVTSLRATRNRETPGRYAHPIGTYFQGRGEAGRNGMMTIDRVVAWSRTAKGGRQLPLLAEPPSGGCMRWGLCEPPNEEGQ